MTTSLITGATAGIGRGFAEALACEGDDLVLVARQLDRLSGVATDLQRRYGIAVEVLPADLADPAHRLAVEARLADDSAPVSTLVNNAGFGVRQRFVGGDVEPEQEMIDVLVAAPMRLTAAAVPGMVARGRGRILNVSSIAGWITSGTYAASKAWVRVFTEGLAMELAGSGVTATAICPGYVRTEFHERAGMNMSAVPAWMWLDVETVVAKALRDSRRGRAVSVAGAQYRLLSLVAQYAPRPMVRRVTAGRSTARRTGRVDVSGRTRAR
jgi:short-subunit dehydrogenase